jgi:hypothetical protein
MERRLVVTLLTDRISRREDAVVYRARFSHQARPLELGLLNKPNDFTHVQLQFGILLFYITIIISFSWEDHRGVCNSSVATNG